MNRISALTRSVAAGTIDVTAQVLRLASVAADRAAAHVRPVPREQGFDAPATGPPPGAATAPPPERPAVERAFDDEAADPAFADDVELGVPRPPEGVDVLDRPDPAAPVVMSGPDPAVAPTPAPAPEPISEADIAELAALNATDVIAAVPGLSTAELRMLHEHETAGKQRKTVLEAIEAAGAMHAPEA